MIMLWAFAAFAVVVVGAWAQDRWPRSIIARIMALFCGAWFAGVWLAVFLLS